MTHKHWIVIGIVVVVFLMMQNGSLNTLLGGTAVAKTS